MVDASDLLAEHHEVRGARTAYQYAVGWGSGHAVTRG